jgi:pyrimidine-nucleoside phosphorylase
MIPRDVIAAKRDGRELDAGAIASFVRGFLDGTVADYQMSAFLMAVMLRGLSPRETADLTRIMVETGETLAFPGVPGSKVDKHSTGGVGDLISLVLAPAVAACGVPVPMISGRGLGHTGGTLDKLESIPGFRTDLDAASFAQILGEVGCVMGRPTARIAPADAGMYALRDVTGTVESIPLIVSSILSKKVAEGIDALVLDVKFGRGAFMGTEEDAERLARELTRVGGIMGLTAAAFLTDMDRPLGTAVGNALEVASALECLRGNGPQDVMELVLTLGAAMLCLGKPGNTWQNSWKEIADAVSGGRALAAFRDLVAAQGGDASVVDDPGSLPQAPVAVPVAAERSGFVADVNPRVLGEAVVELGGGRRRAEDAVDPAVGIRLLRRCGDRVAAGEDLAVVLARDADTGKHIAETTARGAFRVAEEPPPERALIRGLVTGNGSVPWAGGETWDREAGAAAGGAGKRDRREATK